MAVPQATSGTLTNSVRTAYGNKYIEAADFARVYDQFAEPVGQVGVEQAARLNNAVQIPFLSDMEVTEQVISQVADIETQNLRDATASITPTSRGDALQWTEELALKVYTNYGESRFQKLGKNMAETVDILAQAAALKGELVIRGAARASLDAGTTGHNLSTLSLAKAESLMTSLKVPAFMGNGRSQWMALGHPDVFFDFRTSGDVVNVAYYQDKEILFNGELGQYGSFKLISPAWAKVFAGAGAANASVVGTTLSTAANALAVQILVASSTNIESYVGRFLTIADTAVETGNTHYPMNERVFRSADYTTGLTIDIVGEGANGGLRFDHVSGATVSNADTVYPVVFGGPRSLAKLYPSSYESGPDQMDMGQYGVIVGPKYDGILNQFRTLGWKWLGGYGRWVESWIVRGEFSSRLDA
jgi:N4-gp56 family major capsid protein